MRGRCQAQRVDAEPSAKKLSVFRRDMIVAVVVGNAEFCDFLAYAYLRTIDRAFSRLSSPSSSLLASLATFAVGGLVILRIEDRVGRFSVCREPE